MVEKFNGKVEGIEPRVGMKDGKPWSLYLLLVSGATFVTFNELLIKDICIGDEVLIEYAVKKKGQFENNEIQKISKKIDMVKTEDVLKENIVEIEGQKYKVVFIKI